METNDIDIRNYSSENECVPDVVTGKLVWINFQKQEFQIELLDGKFLDASYRNVKEAESILFQAPERVVQVHGIVTYNKRDEPLSIDQVDQILPIDPRPIEIAEFTFDGKSYKIEPSLKFDVSFDFEEYFYIIDGDLDILFTGDTRKEIEDDLDYTLNIFWMDYVVDDPQKLASDALQVREEMLERFRD